MQHLRLAPGGLLRPPLTLKVCTLFGALTSLAFTGSAQHESRCVIPPAQPTVSVEDVTSLLPASTREHLEAGSNPVLIIEVGLEYDPLPTPGSHELTLVYPNPEAVDLLSETVGLLYSDSGPDPCATTCFPADVDLGEYKYTGKFVGAETFPYSFDEDSVGTSVSFFALLAGPLPSHPSEPYVIGYTAVEHATFSSDPALGYPIAFVSQVPMTNSFKGLTEPFANHLSDQTLAPKGGDLWIVYPNGQKRNLTAAAGYGNSGFQGLNAIAVRDPFVHWDAQKILFSMAHKGQIAFCSGDQCPVNPWQIYEISGIGPNDNPVITKVPGQPENYNNTGPVYTPDDKIVFMSDKVRDGYEHLYPYLDEYELEATNSGVFRLDPATGEVNHLDDAPSGTNWTTIDSFGRILYTRWDHLNRDETNSVPNSGFDNINFPNEETTDVALAVDAYDQDVFPEPASPSAWDYDNTDYWHVTHRMEHFFPWMMNPDGTGLETLNHVGRHELNGYFNVTSGKFGGLSAHEADEIPPGMKIVDNVYQLSEHPSADGWYFAINGPESHTHSGGQIMRIYAAPGVSPNDMQVRWVTHPATSDEDDSPGPANIGFFRNPVRLSTGELIASWTPTTSGEANLGTSTHPISKYHWRLVIMDESGPWAKPGPFLTGSISKSVNQHKQVNGFTSSLMYHDGPLWQLSPVEVRPRPRPPLLESSLEAPERSVFESAGVNENELRAWMKENNLALIVSRNVTSRDAADDQQVYNLRIRGTNTKTIANNKPIWDVNYLQIFQGDRTRGYEGEPGRRVHATPMHDPAAVAANLPSGGPEGSVPLGPDGSQAAFVPAERALSWQITNDDLPIVRERFWLSFQPGEIRTCASCHGVNDANQAGNLPPENPPEQLRQLLLHWKASQP